MVQTIKPVKKRHEDADILQEHIGDYQNNNRFWAKTTSVPEVSFYLEYSDKS